MAICLVGDHAVTIAAVMRQGGGRWCMEHPPRGHGKEQARAKKCRTLAFGNATYPDCVLNQILAVVRSGAAAIEPL
jgi:hypothetical protein